MVSMPRPFLAALLASSVLAGCGYSLSGPDPGRPRNRVPTCDTGKGLVALDGVMATGLGVMSLALVSADEPGAALLPLALGALYLGGAVKGNQATSKCREAIEQYSNSYERQMLAVDGRGSVNLDEDDDETEHTRRPGPPLQAQPQPLPSRYSQPQPQSYPQPYPPPPPPPQAPQPQQPQPQGRAQTPPYPQPQPRPAAPSGDDGAWSDFWREVP